MNTEKTLHQQLTTIQQNLKVAKKNVNKFGGYKYRSCEDILEAVKPLLGELSLIINDEVQNIGDRYYIKATAELSNGPEVIVASAYARESLEKKGMDEAQITGSASSYARKYALNGLFAIDDTQDSDAEDNSREDSDPAWMKSDVMVPSSASLPVLQDQCVKCRKGIPKRVVDYSLSMYGKLLCMDCQRTSEKVK